MKNLIGVKVIDMFIELHLFSPENHLASFNVNQIVGFTDHSVNTTKGMFSVEEDYDDIKFKIKTAEITNNI